MKAPLIALFTALFLCGSLIFSAHADLTELKNKPFWREKAKVFKRIEKQRAIIVSVRSQPSDENKDGSKKKHRKLRMQGGGMVYVPQKFAFEESRDFEILKKTGDYVKELRFNPETNRLYLHTAAFRYHAKMHLDVTFKEKDDKSFIEFEIVEGVFKGMRGGIGFERFTSERTLIGLYSLYSYEELPIPRFFINFGLEFVIQKMSERIRSVIESEYRSQDELKPESV